MAAHAWGPLGVCSWSLKVTSVPQLERLTKGLGLGHVQIACGDPNHAQWEEGDRLPAAARAASFQMTAAMLGFPGEDYSTPQIIRETGGFGPPALREERLRLLEWGIGRTIEFGLSDLSTHAGFIPEVGSADRGEFLRTLGQVGLLAADAHVTVTFETGQETAELLRTTLDELDCPNLKVNFDPANMLLYDMGDPLRAVETLAPFIRGVHLKDAIRPTAKGEWGSELPLGKGEVNIPAFLDALRKIDYRGPLCVEREVGNAQQRYLDIAEGLKLVRPLIDG